MALAPDPTNTFLREVDENLRRDQLRDFGKKYGGWLAAAVALFLAAAGGYIYWQYHKQQRSEQQVEQLAQTYTNIGSGKAGNALQQFDELSNAGSEAVRASALFAAAALALQQNNSKLATAKYREVAGDDGMPKPYRDIALIRHTALEFDQLQPQEVIPRMEPLAKPGGPWFGSAGEMTAMALIKQGKRAEAGRLFATIANDRTVPDSIRARSVQIAGSLGVDASAALGPQAQ